MDKGLSYIKNESHIPLDYSTIGKVLEKAAVKNKDQVFMLSKEQQRNVTFQEMLEEADNFAAGLLSLGLKIGDKIGIIVANSVELVVINFATIRGGFISVNLNPALQPRELEYCIKISELNCLICVDKYKISNILDILKEVVPEIEDSNTDVLESKHIPSLKHVIVISENNYRGTSTFEHIQYLGKTAPKDKIRNHQDNIKCEDLFTILFTSGTTGNPKAVAVTHFQMNNMTHILGLRLGLHERTVKFCFVLPMFHLFGLEFFIISSRFGSTLVLPSHYYNPEKTLEVISEEKCTIMLGPPTMFGDLVKVQKTKDLSIYLEEGICGAAPCPEQLYRNIVDILKIKLCMVYGTTETLMVSWPRQHDQNEFTSKSVGHLLEHLEAKIVNSDGKLVPIGAVGELRVRGYSVIKSYFSGNSEIFDDDGWFKTGDVLFFDHDEQLHIVGRLKEIINRGGEKISPVEVEDILETHDDILEAQVVGTTHERLGEEVCACLKLKPGSTVTLADVKSFCKGKLSYYKIPSTLRIMDNFPRTPLGKVQKAKISEQIMRREIEPSTLR